MVLQGRSAHANITATGIGLKSLPRSFSEPYAANVAKMVPARVRQSANTNVTSSLAAR